MFAGDLYLLNKRQLQPNTDSQAAGDDRRDIDTQDPVDTPVTSTRVIKATWPAGHHL